MDSSTRALSCADSSQCFSVQGFSTPVPPVGFDDPISPPRPPPRSHKVPLESHSLSSKYLSISTNPFSAISRNITSQQPSTTRFTPTLGSRPNIYALSSPPTRLSQPHPIAGSKCISNATFLSLPSVPPPPPASHCLNHLRQPLNCFHHFRQLVHHLCQIIHHHHHHHHQQLPY
jgi:hypothetical protein